MNEGVPIRSSFYKRTNYVDSSIIVQMTFKYKFFVKFFDYSSNFL